jgi:hypothetical protein
MDKNTLNLTFQVFKDVDCLVAGDGTDCPEQQPSHQLAYKTKQYTLASGGANCRRRGSLSGVQLPKSFPRTEKDLELLEELINVLKSNK